MRSTLLFALAGATLAFCVGCAVAPPLPVVNAATPRSGPGSRWPVIALIPAEKQVDSSGCAQGWARNWRRVNVGGGTGRVVELVLNRAGELFAPRPKLWL